jgi:large subunit ribosomal protein L14e
MFDIGRVCMKTAGRDAGKTCVIIDVLESQMVMIDGQTRRRKCSVTHLEPLDKTVEISKNAANSEVVAALKGIGIECAAKGGVAPEAEPQKDAPAKKTKTAKPKKAPSTKAKPKAKKESKK